MESNTLTQSISNGSRYFLDVAYLHESGVSGAITGYFFGDNGEMIAGCLWCPTQGIVYG